ncbi:hypothetical protein Btru_027658 [Bulinus truncatus]|nr:hypothetical protein Btru_027658 [Bulinus truncatus]
MALEKENNFKINFSKNSPVNKYDLLTLEQHEHGLTEEHVLLVFRAFEDLIPHLGVFTQIFKKLHADLLAAVYSDELTGASENSKEYVQRKPYFLLVKQDQDQKHELIEQLTGHLEMVKKSLFEKHKELNETMEIVSHKDTQINELNIFQCNLQKKIEDQENEMRELEKQLEDQKDSARFTEHQLSCDIVDLREALDDAKKEIRNLSFYKKSYEDIYYAFMNKHGQLDDYQKKKKSEISTKSANLQNEIESAQKLEDQMLIILNTIMEEYDKQIDAHRCTVIEKSNQSFETDAEQDLRELEFDEANQELRNIQLTFQNSVDNLLTELGLLQQHTGMLHEHLQMLEEMKPSFMKKKSEVNHGWKEDSVLFAGLDVDESESHTDPFIAQEQIFSKYSAMLYTSNNQGKSFEEFKDAKYCASCGEKTLICPHKLSGPEKILILPHHCSHIKITRPKVRINKQDSKKEESADQQWGLLQMNNSLSQSKTGSSTPMADISRESSLMGMGETLMNSSMQKVWEDYYKRTKSTRKIPRFITIEQTKAVIEHFLGYIIWTDDFLTVKDEVDDSIVDSLYRFMHDRYAIEDVANMATHDFLSAITQYNSVDKFVQLLGQVLIGNLDAACLRYMLLICDFINSIDWKEVEDFRAFATAVYPFLNDDDYENLQMSYTSFSENKVSKHHVAAFVINLIIKYREPRFHDMENKLVQYQGQENGHLTEKEFREATDNIIPLCNEQLRNRLYIQSEKAAQVDGSRKSVAIMKLAQIASFLALQQMSTVIKENAILKVKERRENPKTTGDYKGQTSLKDQDTADDHMELLTMSYIKHIAVNINRQCKETDEYRQIQSEINNQNVKLLQLIQFYLLTKLQKKKFLK